jgi:hypothetical protein
MLSRAALTNKKESIVEDLKNLVSRLKEQKKGCEEKALDMKGFKFNVSEQGEISLVDEISTPYWFKQDPDKPKNPKVVHAMKQFCKLLGIPYSFFIKNPEAMKKNLTGCWIPTLKAEKSIILAKLRKLPSGYTIRAILPAEFTNISNSDIMETLYDVVKDDFDVEFAIGTDPDDLILHVRFISKEKFTAVGEDCKVGFSVVASELGASPILVETLLYREASKTSFIASYSGESYFKSDYEGIQSKDIKELFPRLAESLKCQLNDIKVLIQSSKEITESRDTLIELLKSLKLKKGLNDKFHTKLYQEVESMIGTQVDRWMFANKVSMMAKDFDADKRVKIERVAGELIGLSFEKS